MTAYCKRLFLIVIILLSCVGCDRITKVAAHKYLAFSQPISYAGDFFRLQYSENHGAFLSLGAALPAGLRFWLLVVLTGASVSAMLVFILVKRSLSPFFAMAFSLIIGGGVGNLIDRTFNNGTVIDFMNVGVGSLRTGIFNVADVAIMLGTAMLIIRKRHIGKLETTFRQ